MKEQPNRLPLGGYTYTDPAQTVAPGVTELGLQGRMERHAQRPALPRGALGRLRLLRSALRRTATRSTSGATRHAAGPDRRARRDRRPIAIASRRPARPPTSSTPSTAATPSSSAARSTTKRSGAAARRTSAATSSTSTPTACRARSSSACRPRPAVSGRYASDDGELLVVNKLDQQDLFVNDTWSKGRVTMNLGAAVGSLQGLDARAEAAGVHERPGQRAGADVPRARLLHLEQPRPAHRRDLRPGRRRQDGGQGQLRPVLAQPGSGRQRRRQPEPEQQERHLHLDRSQRRPATTRLGEEVGEPDRDHAGRHDPARPEHHVAVLARRVGLSRAPGQRRASARASASSTRPKTI